MNSKKTLIHSIIEVCTQIGEDYNAGRNTFKLLSKKNNFPIETDNAVSNIIKAYDFVNKNGGILINTKRIDSKYGGHCKYGTNEFGSHFYLSCFINIVIHDMDNIKDNHTYFLFSNLIVSCIFNVLRGETKKAVEKCIAFTKKTPENIDKYIDLLDGFTENNDFEQKGEISV
jgi:hypothetical protein